MVQSPCWPATGVTPMLVFAWTPLISIPTLDGSEEVTLRSASSRAATARRRERWRLHMVTWCPHNPGRRGRWRLHTVTRCPHNPGRRERWRLHTVTRCLHNPGRRGRWRLHTVTRCLHNPGRREPVRWLFRSGLDCEV